MEEGNLIFVGPQSDMRLLQSDNDIYTLGAARAASVAFGAFGAVDTRVGKSFFIFFTLLSPRVVGESVVVHAENIGDFDFLRAAVAVPAPRAGHLDKARIHGLHLLD